MANDWFSKSLSVLFFMTLVCCSHDPDPQNQPNPGGGTVTPKTCLVKTERSAASENTVARNGQGLPITLTYTPSGNATVTCSIQYDAQNRIVKLLQGNAYIEYAYDGTRPVTGTVYTRTDTQASFQELWQFVYHYSASGQLATTTDQAGTTHRFTYDASGNMISQHTKTTSTSEVLTHAYTTFDTKKNPDTKITFDQLLIPNGAQGDYSMTILRLPAGSARNVTQETVRLDNGGYEVRTFAYQYNDSGYPIVMLVNGDGGRETVRWGYECK
ncbi:RHS repeat domain-containing protein [Chryseolinea lacunae]|uniref:YD repeat-containing protein n=1 Tax=Chryseolinea lacunae TaxID=2801331 RepID=A0ABS1KKX3_9BACT|nr:RHS repeat domain-containing protein [Chryseolinea lacunae]MBL0739872.1 hypothetical protein [Chryseolinea lacunae]